MDLEKLLINDKFKRKSVDEDRLEFVQREGHTFLAPISERESKINGIRRWEQAFRVYASIFCRANPQRSDEIWQYIHSINTATANFIWDNVAYYDYTFRQMMSLNPQRSWGKTYGQLWNLAMVNPIQRQTGQSHGQSGNNWNSARKTPHQNRKKKGRNRRPCWKFNKNQSSGPNCDFDHKCSYCGQPEHAVLDCAKLHSEKDKKKNE